MLGGGDSQQGVPTRNRWHGPINVLSTATLCRMVQSPGVQWILELSWSAFWLQTESKQTLLVQNTVPTKRDIFPVFTS